MGNGEVVTGRNPRTYGRNTAPIFGLLLRYFPVGSNNFPDSFQRDPPVSGSIDLGTKRKRQHPINVHGLGTHEVGLNT